MLSFYIQEDVAQYLRLYSLCFYILILTKHLKVILRHIDSIAKLLLRFPLHNG